MLIGRATERAELDRALAATASGKGRVAIVLGEAGVGKSILAEWVSERAAAVGFGVLRGGCSAAAMPPWWPWRRALRGAVADDVFRGHDGRPDRADGDLVMVSVLDALADLARARPLLVVIEDAHWADSGSSRLLSLVAESVPSVRLMLLVTARDEAVDGPETATGLPTAALRIPLPPLTIDEVAELAADTLGHPITEDDAALLHTRTGGNPFFVHEVTRLIAAHGPAAAMVVPPGVHEVLQRRIARLDQRDAEILAVAAVAASSNADTIEHDIVAEAAEASGPEVVHALAGAAQARLVTSDGVGGHRFRHSLIREHLEQDLPEVQRARVHRAVAEALEVDGRGTAPRLAHHWSQAAGPEASDRAVHHALIAARAAMSGAVFDSAARLFALALERSTPRAEPVGPRPAHGADDAPDPLSVSIEYGEALLLAGEPGRARAVLLGAADAADRSGRPVELAWAALTLGGGLTGFEVPGADPEQVGWLRRADATLPPDQIGLRAAVRARLSLALTATAPQAERAALAADAVASARTAGDPDIESAVLAAFCDALAGPDHVAARIDGASTMVHLAGAEPTGMRRRTNLLLARRLLLAARLERGELAAAYEQAAAYEELAVRMGVPRYAWLPEIWRGMRALLDADPRRALRHAAAAEEIGRRVHSENAELMAYSVASRAHLELGTSADMLARHDEILGRFGADMPVMYWASPARYQLAGGLAEPARAALRAFSTGTAESMPKDAEWLECHWSLADIAVDLADRSAATALYATLFPYRDLWAVDGLGAVVLGTVAEQLGRLAAFLGDVDVARDHLAAAGQAYRVAGAPALLARLPAPPQPSADPDPVAGVVRSESGSATAGHWRLEGVTWLVDWHGKRTTFPDAKGFHDLSVLLARPGQVIPAAELVAAAGGPVADPAGADLGPLLDETARRAYRVRLAELDRELSDAEVDADLHRTQRLRTERAFLVDELTRALGLAGRPRIAGDATDRARKAVTMRIRAAIKTVRGQDPLLAQHLTNSVRTGRLCSYQPEQPVRWRT